MSQKMAVGVVFVAAMFMSIMDATIVTVALPTIGRGFGPGVAGTRPADRPGGPGAAHPPEHGPPRGSRDGRGPSLT